MLRKLMLALLLMVPVAGTLRPVVSDIPFPDCKNCDERPVR